MSGSVIVLSDLKNQITDINREMASLRKGMGFMMDELIELTSKLEALEILTVDPEDQEDADAVNQIQAGFKSAIALEVGFDK